MRNILISFTCDESDDAVFGLSKKFYDKYETISDWVHLRNIRFKFQGQIAARFFIVW